MDTIDESRVFIQPLSADVSKGKVAAVDMLRLDLIHPFVSGNKWYKLWLSLEQARAEDAKRIITFGGAWSNHLLATSVAANLFGFSSVGIVRGTHAKSGFTDTLKRCVSYGMHLEFLSREEYDQKTDSVWLDALKNRYPRSFVIPEGGSNEFGRRGAERIAALVPPDYTHVCLAAGTGTTFVGLRNALPPDIAMLGFVPMKGGAYLREEIEKYLKEGKNINWRLFDEWHFGGFGKRTPELVDFMSRFKEEQGFALDVVYTSKMMYGLAELLARGYFPSEARMLCIHTGGLQGNASLSFSEPKD